jgi:hypothetical protein
MHRVASVVALLTAAVLLTGCDNASDDRAAGDGSAAPAAEAPADPARCVVADPQGELILHPGSLTARSGQVRLEGVELEDADNLEIVESDTVAFSGNPTVRGIILDYPPMKNAGLADSLADWDQRRALVGRTLTPADGLQAVLVAVRLSDPASPGHLTGVALEASAEGRTYPQPVLVKPHGEPCTVDDIASTRSWLG